MEGLFLVMEGPDGSGKTTQIDLLREYLYQEGMESIITREPGGTVIGEAIRGVILNPDYETMSSVTEMLLYAASRSQLMAEVIVPALQEGKVVISDRFVDSSIVYQGIARGLGKEMVATVNAPGIGEYRPDCIFFIDISEEEGINRKKKQKKLDRMEQESIDFHYMVSKGYREVLADRPEVIYINGEDSVENIQEMIRSKIKELIIKKNHSQRLEKDKIRIEG